MGGAGAGVSGTSGSGGGVSGAAAAGAEKSVVGGILTGRPIEDCSMNTRARRSTLNEVLRIRKLAGDVLTGLVEDRLRSEHRLAELGQRDQFKAITGRSSMDTAVVSTRQMIENMDSLIAEMNVKARPSRPARTLPVSAAPARPQLLQAGSRR